MKTNYKPRILVVLGFFILIFIIILVRLYILQIKGQSYFKTLAEQQYLLNLTINPKRGKIFDASGKVPLAMSIPSKSAFIVPKNIKQHPNLEAFLKREYKNIFNKIKRNRNKSFLWLERQIPKDRLKSLKKLNIDGICFLEETKRFYPFPSTSTVVGFTDIDNIGIEGVELTFNSRLQGQKAIIEIKRDARTKSLYFDKKIIKKGKKGEPISLTLDSNLQFLAHEELKKTVDELSAKSGSCLIINPDNGYIVSMVNYPDFNPNEKLKKDLSLTKNKIVTECYEFGSVIKTFSALAALEEGVVTPEEPIECEGKVAYIDKFRVENWKAVETIPFSDVIRYSANVGVAKVVKRLGPKFYTHLKRLGFGKKTGISFPGERSGFVNPPENWSKSSLIVMSFGYEIMATILQLGKAFSIIANGGYDLEPILIKNPARLKNTSRKKIYSDKSISQIKNILQAIGKRYSKNLKGFKVMGKTGTARILKNKKYSKKDHLYSFAGIIEKGNYRRVIVTFIKEPKGKFQWSSQITAPLFNRIAEKVIINDLTRGKIKDF